jgi:hypothetical protein
LCLGLRGAKLDHARLDIVVRGTEIDHFRPHPVQHVARAVDATYVVNIERLDPEFSICLEERADPAGAVARK